jgi:surface carbohydrate biosynthesis protein (TIGR04326 family)
MPLADFLAINGPVAKKNMLDFGFPPDRLIEVEALRFLPLVNLPKIYNSTTGKSSLRILICGDFLMATNKILLKWIEQASKELPGNTVYMFKSHPAYPMKLPENLDINIKIITCDLSDALEYSNIVFTSNISSVAVNAYLSGCRVIQMFNDGDFNSSPLRGLHDVTYVKNINELATKIKECNVYAYQKRMDYFFLDNALPLWKKILIED